VSECVSKQNCVGCIAGVSDSIVCSRYHKLTRSHELTSLCASLSTSSVCLFLFLSLPTPLYIFIPLFVSLHCLSLSTSTMCISLPPVCVSLTLFTPSLSGSLSLPTSLHLSPSLSCVSLSLPLRVFSLPLCDSHSHMSVCPSLCMSVSSSLTLHVGLSLSSSLSLSLCYSICLTHAQSTMLKTRSGSCRSQRPGP
jgi:hypothetical protein